MSDLSLPQNSCLPPISDSQGAACIKPNPIRYFVPPNLYAQSWYKPANNFVLFYPYFDQSMHSYPYVYSSGQLSHLPIPYDLQYQGVTFQGSNVKHISAIPSQISSDEPIRIEQVQKSKENSLEKENHSVEQREDESLQEVESSFDLELSTKENYKYRNVCKSILRHMNAYIIRNKVKLTDILLNVGYREEEIKRGFKRLEDYGDLERRKGCKKMSAKLVKYAITSKSLYSYVLKETLDEIIKNWNQMRFGKIIRKNFGVYKEICNKCYEKLLEIFLY